MAGLLNFQNSDNVDYRRLYTTKEKFMQTNTNGYIAMYKGKRLEIYAPTKYEAQKQAAAFFKAKKQYEVDVYLAEKNGEVVLQTAC